MAFERLTREDARVLTLEAGSIRGHICKVLLTGARETGERTSIEELRVHLERRLDRVPRLRQRLARTPLAIADPIWVDDAGFDIRRHVESVPAAGAVDRDGLVREVARLMSTRLDPARPLWKVDLIEALDDGGSALVVRLHHCMADGMASVRILSAILLDPEPFPPEPRAAPWTPGPVPGAARLAALAALSRAHSGVTGARDAGRALVSSDAWRAGAQTMARLPATLRRELAARGAPSPLATPIGPRREVAFASASLTEVRRIGKALDSSVTVNDVVLAAVGGGLRRWLAREGASAAGLRVKVPVSLHARDDAAGALANRDSFMFVDLPLAEDDPVERLLAINAETSRRKRHHDAETLDAFLTDLARVSHSLERLASRWAMSPRVFAVNVSNVPGPRAPVFVMGAPLREAYSLAEVGNRHALRVSIFSAAEQLFFGFCADAAAVENLDVLAAGVEEELETLGARSGGDEAASGPVIVPPSSARSLE